MAGFVSSKDRDGLGLIDLEITHICLLSKWLWKLMNSTDGLWLSLVWPPSFGAGTVEPKKIICDSKN
jgi:hypothetical protein